MRLGAAILLLAGLGAPAAALAEDGASLFEASCSACHQSGGIGNPGIAPPLNDPALWQRLGSRAPDYVAGVMISGMSGTITAGGQMYAGLIMPSHAAITDAELAAIGTYILSTVNATGLALDAAHLEAARQAKPSHADLRKLRKGSTE
ncbi:MAG: cytochrome c [Hydrogenophaga sp.]|nr:cytochrome c [Hydrogenophaga sp.]